MLPKAVPQHFPVLSANTGFLVTANAILNLFLQVRQITCDSLNDFVCTVLKLLKNIF